MLEFEEFFSHFSRFEADQIDSINLFSQSSELAELFVLIKKSSCARNYRAIITYSPEIFARPFNTVLQNNFQFNLIIDFFTLI